MMENKLNLSDLFQELAEKSGLSKTAAETFAKAFFAQIEQGLLQDGIVKINGWGTFKAQWNEPRKSVNINTGEDIVIPGHTRITFTPEIEIKERINAPFAYLQPVVLGEAPLQEEETLEDTPQTTPDTPSRESDSVGDTLQKLSDDADEIKSLLCDINGADWMNSSDNLSEESLEETHTQVEEPIEEEKTEEVVHEPAECVVEATNDSVDAQVKVDNVPSVETPVEETTSIATPAEKQSSVPEEVLPRPKKGWKILLGTLCTLLLLLVGGYFYLTHRVEQWAKDKIETAQTDEVLETQLEETQEQVITLDESLETTPETSVDEDGPTPDPLAEEPQDALLTPPLTYDEFIDTVQLTEGSRLAWLAKKHYGDARFWVYIYAANQETLPNPNNIPVGTIIKLPKLPQELINPSDTNCIRLAKELHIKYTQKH